MPAKKNLQEIKKERLKKRKNPTGGFLPGSEELYTPEVIADVLKQAMEILLEDESISLDGELAIALYKNKVTTSISTLRLVINNKYTNNNEIVSLKENINTILEARKCKDKSMYPGIAAMALKNKHGWRDQTDLNHSGDITVKRVTFDGD